MSEHTKTPWVYVDDGYSGSIWSTVDDKPFVRVASFIDCEVSDETEPTARHIVHCVNNHESLVAMLRELVETEDDGLFEMLGDDYCERLNELLAALEAEKGGEL